jgi:hypothetical protein
MNTRSLIFIAGILFPLFNVKAASSEELFPEFRNWKLSIDETVYTPQNLWELIDGAADIYLAYDFQDLHIGEYTGDKDEMIRVELYRHGSPENTFGIYSAERMPDYHFINVGVEGYTSFGSLNFFTGNYYVKIIWSGTGESDDEILVELAEKIEKKLNQENNWPDILSYFPEMNKLPKSEGYSNENFLGYSYLHSAFTTGYEINDKEFKLFIIKLNDSTEVKITIEKYFKTIHFNASGNTMNEYIVTDPYNGKIGMGIKDNFLFGVYNLDDEQLIASYLDQLRNSIPVKNHL